eukprot:scaffold16276_cov73-Phaeocystis_antarctica.AAC.2
MTPYTRPLCCYTGCVVTPAAASRSPLRVCSLRSSTARAQLPLPSQPPSGSAGVTQPQPQLQPQPS